MAGVSEAVLEVFKRFDADGSGAISREELSEVLKSLDASFDDEAVDSLLVLADASGDGELQIEEFLQWIFAEDQSSLGAAISGVHDITLSIRGCSFNKSFNGDYVQQVGEAHCQRPVYFCAKNQQLLFYCSKYKQWAIFPRPSTRANCRIRTLLSAHRPGDGVKWSAWQKKKKSFVEESNMTCTLKTSEEALSATPAEFIQAVDVPFLTGVFKKQEEMKDGRPVYYNSKSNAKFEYDQAKQRWNMLAFDEGGEKKTCEMSSAETAGFSPERATWKFKGKVIRMASLEYKLVTEQEGWKDPDFPHDMSSIGMNFKDCAWIRAIHLIPEASLFGEGPLMAADQGNLGDCGLIASIAAVAEFPDYIKENIFVTKARLQGVLTPISQRKAEKSRNGASSRPSQWIRKKNGWLKELRCRKGNASAAGSSLSRSTVMVQKKVGSCTTGEDMFAELSECDRSNYMMVTTVMPGNANTSVYDGLVKMHGYSLLHCVEVEGVKLVQMRNPKGSFEWTGPWKDGGEEWKKNKGISQALKVKKTNRKGFWNEWDDGAFWMDFEDFEWNFENITVHKHSMPSNRAAFELEEETD